VFSEEAKRDRFAQWEQIGLERIKHDLLTTGGFRVVGGTQAERDLAWEWVRTKEAVEAKRKAIAEAITFKVGLPGVNIDAAKLVPAVVPKRWWRRKHPK
jgi:hypothetical protein